LRVNLIEGEGARMFGGRATSIEAYLKVMKGYDHIQRWNKNDNTICRQLCKEAIALDPEYAAAYELLGWTYKHEAVNNWTYTPDSSFESAIELAKKAQALDDSRVTGSYLLTVIYRDTGQLEMAIGKGEKAISLEPNNADYNLVFAETISRTDRHDEAIDLIAKAIRLNPIVPGWYAIYIFRIYRRLERIAEVIPILKKLADLVPEGIYADTYLMLGFAYRMTGKYKEAIAEFRKGLQLNPDYLEGHIGLTATYSLVGLDDEARIEAAEVLRLDPKFSVERQYALVPYKDEPDKKTLIHALRKASLK